MRSTILAGGIGITALLLSIAPFALAQGTDPPHIRTQSGEDLGTPSLKDISEEESSVHFIDSADVKRRQMEVLKDGRIEALTLRNDATLIYTKNIIRGYTFGPASYDPAPARLKYKAGTKYLAYYGFVFKRERDQAVGCRRLRSPGSRARNVLSL